jgi:stage IV sporulation protein FB
MFSPLPRTPLDLRFRLAGVPVRVSVFFWLVLAMLGQWTFQHSWQVGLVWLACGFVSLLTHEFGHALAFRWYRVPVAVELQALGGVAIPSYALASPARRLFVALAGPLAGFALVGLAALVSVTTTGGQHNLWLGFALQFLIGLGIVWNLFNLLPIWPLDGGRALRELLMLSHRRRPDRIAHGVGAVVGGLLTLCALVLALRVPGVVAVLPEWLNPGPLGTLCLGLLAVQNYMLFQQQSRGPRLFTDDDSSPHTPWQRQA